MPLGSVVWLLATEEVVLGAVRCRGRGRFVCLFARAGANLGGNCIAAPACLDS